MPENFYTILTSIGKSKLANSMVSGNKVNLKILQVGDGNGTYHEPSEDQTSLINKVWIGEISSISTDESNSNWIVIQTIIPANDGGFYIREAGIFDEDGDLIAVSKVSETYKPVISEGSTKDISIKILLEVNNSENIALKIDPNVAVATKNDIEVLESEIENVNTQLSEKANDTDSSRTTLSKTVTGAINELNSGKASLVSPVFTGTPIAPTQATTDNSTKIATTAFINNLLTSIGSTIVFNNDSTYAFRGVKGIMADSDFWRIGGGATASDFGYMEIATADNGSEPIYVRQYNGTWATIARTLTLLDGSGNTSIPGNLGVTGNISCGGSIISTNGVLEIGSYIDFHNTGSSNDFDYRMHQSGGRIYGNPLNGAESKILEQRDIINNCGATVPGSPLDAVQGNYLIGLAKSKAVVGTQVATITSGIGSVVLTVTGLGTNPAVITNGDYAANPAQILGITPTGTDTIRVYYSNGTAGLCRFNISFVTNN